MDLSAYKDIYFDPDHKRKERKSYNHEELTTFLANSSIKDYFRCAPQITDSHQLLSYLNATLSSHAWGVFDLEELLDLYILAIMMMTYDEENFTVVRERFMLVDTVSNLGDGLQLPQIDFIANGLYEKFVHGEGAKRLQNVLNMQMAIPHLVLSSGHGSGVAMALLLTIFARYTKLPVKLQKTGNAQNAFQMAKFVRWQELADAGKYQEMFMMMRTICLLLNMPNIRKEFHDNEMGSEMHKYFLGVLRGLGRSDNQTFFAMMVERFIAFCVVRGAT